MPLDQLQIPTTFSTSTTVPFNSISNDVVLNVAGIYTSVDVVTSPINGLAAANGINISYRPNIDYAGPDSFTYSATGPDGTSNISTVTVTVLQAPPIARSFIKSVGYDSSNNIIAPIITNPYSSVSLISTAKVGTVAMTGTNFIYSPLVGYYGTDTFSYSAVNAGGVSNTGTITVRVSDPLIIISPSNQELGSASLNDPYVPVNFSATGGAGPYNFSLTGGSLPHGMTFTSGVLSGTPTVGGTYNFVITARDHSTLIPATTSTEYSLEVKGVRWITSPGFLSTLTELTTSSVHLSATGTNITYSVISGHLPSGLSLDPVHGIISGNPDPVINKTNSEFVVRIQDYHNRLRDRTFSIDVVGATQPTWVTPPGYLNVGVNDEFYAINNQYINFQLAAHPTAAPSDATIKYYIADGDGKLPPGITLNQQGLLSGYLHDKLVPDSAISSGGGYDTESYDGYIYDHVVVAANTSTSVMVGYPKIYNFNVTATDGVAQSIQPLTIVVTSMDILQYAPNLMPADITLATYSTYIQPPQWVSSTDLGIIRAGHEHDISVQAYDPIPEFGVLRYQLASKTTGAIGDYGQLPRGLSLDSVTGHIHGFIPYQPFYSEYYSFDISASKFDPTTGQAVLVMNTFNLTVKGQTENDMVWITDSNLGNINAGYISELSVVAKHVTADARITYKLESGALPHGLTLQQDGSISGRADYTSSTGTYSFTVLASDIYELNRISKTFNMSVSFVDNLQYAQIYARPFLSQNSRDYYNNFINNGSVFDPNLIYRYFDTNFGIQQNIKLTLEFGIEFTNIDQYAPALRENFYRRRLYFGDIKTAIAQDSTGTTLYEVIYVDIVDDMTNSSGKSVSSVIYTNDGANIYYPSSIDNMRNRLASVVLSDNTLIKVDKYQNPLFMRTPQPGDYHAPEFMTVMILCYALPGQGAKIVNKIKQSGFDFKLLDFTIDRLIVQNGQDDSTAKYLIIERSSLGDSIPEDSIIYSDNGGISFELSNGVSLSLK